MCPVARSVVQLFDITSINGVVGSLTQSGVSKEQSNWSGAGQAILWNTGRVGATRLKALNASAHTSAPLQSLPWL